MAASYDAASDSVSATVTDAIEAFREALRALTAPADAICMNWRDDNPHGNWETLEVELYRLFVRNFLLESRQWVRSDPALAEYGLSHPSYRSLSWICPIKAPRTALTCFVSKNQAFDHAQFVLINEQGVPVGETEEPSAGLRYGLANFHSFQKEPLVDLHVVD